MTWVAELRVGLPTPHPPQFCVVNAFKNQPVKQDPIFSLRVLTAQFFRFGFQSDGLKTGDVTNGFPGNDLIKIAGKNSAQLI